MPPNIPICSKHLKKVLRNLFVTNYLFLLQKYISDQMYNLHSWLGDSFVGQKNMNFP